MVPARAPPSESSTGWTRPCLGWPGNPHAPASRVSNIGFWDFGVTVTLSLGDAEGPLASLGGGGGVKGKLRPRRDPSSPWAAGRSEAADLGWDGKNRTGDVPLRAIDSMGLEVEAGSLPPPRSGRWETHQAGHLGSGSCGRGWGPGWAGPSSVGGAGAGSLAGCVAHARTCRRRQKL